MTDAAPARGAPPSQARRRGDAGGLDVTMMRAGDGDCLLIRCHDDAAGFRILVDGGRLAAAGHLKAHLSTLAPEERSIDLLVLTHIDGDHVEGALAIARDPDLRGLVREVWFNDARRCAAVGAIDLSNEQGDEFTALVAGSGWRWNERFGGGAVVRDAPSAPLALGGLTRLHLLGPTPAALGRLARAWPAADLSRMGGEATPPGAIAMGGAGVPDVDALARSPHAEDASVTNGSSIAFVLEHGRRRLLLAGDSHARDMVAALEASFGAGPHRFDLAFLPHHGADRNMSPALARVVAADRWAISTTGARHRHPSPRSIARILKLRPGGQPTEFVFNSRHAEASVWGDPTLRRVHRYEASFPQGREQAWVGIAIEP